MRQLDFKGLSLSYYRVGTAADGKTPLMVEATSQAHADSIYKKLFCPGCNGPAGRGPQGCCKECWKDGKKNKRRFISN